MASITCVNCGEHRSGPGTPKNTTRCRVCSVVNQLQFVMKGHKRTKSCSTCSRDFTPCRRDEGMCADCEFSVHLEWRLPWDCITCGSERGTKNKVLDGIPICRHCFQDSTQQPTVLATLNAVIQQQRDNNHWIPPTAEPPKIAAAVKPAEVPKPTGAVLLTQVIDYLIALKKQEPNLSVPERRAKALEGITSITRDRTIPEIAADHGWENADTGLAFLKEPEWEALING